MSIPRLAPRLRPLIASSAASTSRAFASSTTKTTTSPEWPQKTPLGSYYESILRGRNTSPNTPKESVPSTIAPTIEPVKDQPSPSTSAAPTTTTSFSPAGSLPAQPTTPELSPQEKTRLIFGSRVLGPLDNTERLAALQNKSQLIAGVLVPPKPVEPDNCCMSGCVNCVYEQFRDDMEDWTAQNAEAQRRLAAQAATADVDDKAKPEAVAGDKTADAASTADTAGGAGAKWSEPKIAKDMWDDDVLKDMPVGIREFMKQEKRLKDRHAKERSAGL